MSGPAVAFIDCLHGSGKEGGADIAARDLAERLRGAGARTRILSFRDGIPLALPDLLKTKPLLRELTAFPLGGRKGMREAEGGYDVIHLNSLALAPLYRPRLPVVITLHNIQCQKFTRYMGAGRLPLLFNRLTRFPFRLSERRAAGNIDRFICVHRGIADFLRDGMGIAEDRIAVIPNGVDTELFRPGGDKVRRVVFVGRATTTKGFDVLAEAAPMIDAPIMAVTNKMRPAMAARAAAAGMEVRWDLSHRELAPLISSSSLLVLPSWDEEQPLVVIEAMSCGLPVVTTPAGASDLIRDGQGGLVVPPHDPRALARAVNHILGDERMIESMGAANRHIAEASHAWPVVVARVMDVYGDVLDSARRGGGPPY
ncbi:MAG: glycosyltransferase family 4 protein [Actinomycetota bacterium]